MYLSYVVVVISIYQCSSFNVAVKNAIVVKDPGNQKSSYFGYTVAFRKYSTSFFGLIVGAPRGNRSSTERFGLVYECSVNNINVTCSQLALDLSGKVLKNEAWIGGAIAVQDKEEGYAVVCGSRYTTIKKSKRKPNSTFDWMHGICHYWKHKEDIQPLKFDDYAHYNTHLMLMQAGYSAHFVPDKDLLLIGTVGIYNMRGDLIIYKLVNSSLVMHYDTNSKCSTGIFSSSVADYYAGYAVTSGRFLNKATNYVIGAPRAPGTPHDDKPNTGQVLIIDPSKCWELTGQQMGEYFGSSLLVTDVNNDEWDDLIVGAPMYTKKPSDTAHTGYDEGRIYVYVNNRKGELKLSENDEPIMGSAFQGARFGSSLADLGDLNRDGFRDIAVGAPYEDEKGAIYIYHGSPTGLTKKFSQKILARAISLDLSGFGISITSGIDIDQNSFNDIAVGSYDSGHVVILRSHPVVEFHATIESNMDILSFNTSEFIISTCLRYTINAETLPELDVRMHLLLDPKFVRATFLHNNSSKDLKIKLQRNLRNCTESTVKLKENNVNFIQPVEIIMLFEVEHNASNSTAFSSCHPITDPRKPSRVTKKIPFANGCSHMHCKSDLKISENKLEPFIIGSEQNYLLHVEVTNSGDPAFLSHLYFIVPRETGVNRIPQNCRYQLAASDSSDMKQEILVCNLGNPLYASSPTNKQKIVTTFDIDMKKININTKIIMFNVSVNSTSEEMNNADNTLTLSLPLQLDADVIITGRANKEQIFVANAENKQLDIFHIYEVANIGPSLVEQVEIEFQIPTAFKQSSTNITFLQLLEHSVSLKDQLHICDVNTAILSNTDKFIAVDDTPKRSHEDEANDYSPSINRRRRRNILDDGNWQSTTTDVPSNRTMFVNCTSRDSSFLCQQVKCHTGPLITPQDIANVSIKMSVNSTVLELLMKGKDMIQITTIGRISIPNAEMYKTHPIKRSNFSIVHTNFLGQVTGEEVSSWILPLSVAAGIVLLTILTMSLMKAGFFRRKKLEELKRSRNSAEQQRNFGITADNIDCTSLNDVTDD